MSLKLLIFDLDGTLLDTLQDLSDATNTALAEFGLPPLPAEEYKLMVGMGVRILMQRAVSRSTAIRDGELTLTARPSDDQWEVHLFEKRSNSCLDPDALVDAFNRAYETRWAEKTQPYAGIPELLEELTRTGVILTILSNKPDAFTRKVAARYFPASLFQMVHGMRPEFPGKPDPALTLELCRLHSVTPAEAALIGDSGSDMQTAVAAGVLPVGVLWGFRSAEELTMNGATLLASTPAELLGLLQALIA